MARWPNLACEVISSSLQRHFANNEKMILVRNICWFDWM